MNAGRLLAVCALASLAKTAGGEDHHAASYQRRSLQSSSSIVFINAIEGTPFTSAEEDAVQLQKAERLTPGDAATTITTSTTAQYELYFEAPDVLGATGFTLSFVGQLDGAAWTVEIFDFSTGVNAWVTAGTLAGISAAGWGDTDINFPTATPANFIDEASEMMIQLSATGTEIGYLDYAALRTVTGNGTTPVPAPVAAPTAPIAPPVIAPTAPVAAPVAGPTAPLAVPTAPVAVPVAAPDAPPVAAPTSTGGAVAVFVDKISGADILLEQFGGSQLASAELAAVSDTTTSIAFGAIDANQQASYEMYFVAPAAVSGQYTISVTAQLGAGAVASNWKVDMYSFLPVGSDDWVPVGDLTGVTSGAWTTITLTLNSATPANFVEPTVNEYLIQLRTEDATGAEIVFVDQVLIFSGLAVSTPSPAPVTATVVAATPPPTIAPTKAPTIAPTLAPTASPTPGPVEVDLVPCILASGTIEKDVGSVASAYLFNEFFKGFWTATQDIQSPPAAVLDLLVDAEHGKCNVIFVGIVPSAAQKLQLQDYSRKFNVRIVYFDAADTILDSEVQTRLGMQSNFDEPSVGAPRVKRTGGPTDSVVPVDMVTDPTQNNIFNRPVVQSVPPIAGVNILAQYADESGTVIPGEIFTGAENAAIVEYIGADGLEELHVFLGLAWFDQGSWAWAHFIAEWGTRGIFQGERRFYLGGVVDDLFLATGEWIFDPPDFYGTEYRCSGADLKKFAESEARFNAEYGAAIKTEHAVNFLGVLDKVGSAYKSWMNRDANIGLLPKGAPPDPPEGVPQISLPNWLSTTFNPADGQTGVQEEIDAGLFESDDLLAQVQADLDAFFWQSHSLTHLSRDNLGKNDCDIEDGGNVQLAVLLGLFDSDNYCWRSMTSPRITGLFNPNCLQSGADNLMKCYPGDNTYSGPPLTDVFLINPDNQFHAVTTTVAVNGYAGAQIVPRFATNVYFNCVSGKCLVDENDKIRRDVCGCDNLDPALPQGECSLCDDTQSFVDVASRDPSIGPLEALFRTEERTTTRYMLTGRRDKYMFHQANLVPTTWASSSTDPLYVSPRPTNNPSLLEYWYIRVLGELSKYLNTGVFPVQTLKFDNLCHNFNQHESLDSSGAVLTATKDPDGTITGMALTTSSNNGAPIPLTVPSASAAAILGVLDATLSPAKTETYGADTTFTFAAGTLDEGNLSKPALSELPSIPKATLTPEEQAAAEAEAEQELQDFLNGVGDVAEEARVEIVEDAGEQGFVVEDLEGEIDIVAAADTSAPSP
eukprot:g8995.t1